VGLVVVVLLLLVRQDLERQTKVITAVRAAMTVLLMEAALEAAQVKQELMEFQMAAVKEATALHLPLQGHQSPEEAVVAVELGITKPQDQVAQAVAVMGQAEQMETAHLELLIRAVGAVDHHLMKVVPPLEMAAQAVLV
jgi:hypothetical protein